LKKYVFWSVLNQHKNIALTEDLSKYAQGDTFWKAMKNLCETLIEWTPSDNTDKSDLNSRLKMFQETGINKVEIFVEEEDERYAIQCSNTRSFIKTGSERDALLKYIAAKAETSVVNTGEPPNS
jgi:hypothetical protein